MMAKTGEPLCQERGVIGMLAFDARFLHVS